MPRIIAAEPDFFMKYNINLPGNPDDFILNLEWIMIQLDIILKEIY